MTEMLGRMYHWSPHERYKEISTQGLVPLSRSTIASGELPYVCVAPSAKGAWAYSGDMGWAEDIDRWDLWSVELSDKDECRVRTDWGPKIIEVKVYNPIPPDRLWWVGVRYRVLLDG